MDRVLTNSGLIHIKDHEKDGIVQYDLNHLLH